MSSDAKNKRKNPFRRYSTLKSCIVSFISLATLFVVLTGLDRLYNGTNFELDGTTTSSNTNNMAMMFQTKDKNNNSSTSSIHINEEEIENENEEEEIDKEPVVAGNSCNWKSEPLSGFCDGTQPTMESQLYKTAIDCENACCSNTECISFQFREREGCQWGKDVRLGNEKDGPSSWCEPRAPAPWQGQHITNDNVLVAGACPNNPHDSSAGATDWNPNQLQGQCMGLGPKKITSGNTAEACRDACCQANEQIAVMNFGSKEKLQQDTQVQNYVEQLPCKTWQWRSDAGCFYFNREAKRCHDADDALSLEPYRGKRKVVEGRTYTPNAYSGDFGDLMQLAN